MRGYEGKGCAYLDPYLDIKCMQHDSLLGCLEMFRAVGVLTLGLQVDLPQVCYSPCRDSLIAVSGVIPVDSRNVLRVGHYPIPASIYVYIQPS